MSDLKITLFEIELFWEEPQKNRDHIGKLISNAPESDVMILPETFTTGFSMNVREKAEPGGEKTLLWMKEHAQASGSCICGSVMISTAEDVYQNRLYWVFPDGSYEFYDKRHLFTFADEDQYFKPGNRHLVVEYKGWKIQPLICYDLRFPVWARNNPQNPYDILVYVANWPSVRQTAWDKLLPARAIENACYSVGVNRVGDDPNGIIYNGNSTIYDFLGNPEENTVDQQGLKTFLLSKEKLLAFRKKFPVLNDADRFEISD